MLLAPESAGADHLKALARISRLLRDEAVCAKLRSLDQAETIYAVLTDPAGAGETGGNGSNGSGNGQAAS